MVSAIGVGLGLLLVGVAVIAILIAGIKSLSQGKQDTKKIVMMAIPFVIFGVSYAVLGGAVDAGVLTMLFLLGVMLIMIAFSGLRGTFNF